MKKYIKPSIVIYDDIIEFACDKANSEFDNVPDDELKDYFEDSQADTIIEFQKAGLYD
jgi:hypothetical protein